MYVKLSTAALLLTALLLAGPGCREKPPLKLTTRQWARVDTLFTEQLPALRAEMDSLCELDFDERVTRAADSLLRIRREEELLLRAKVPRK